VSTAIIWFLSLSVGDAQAQNSRAADAALVRDISRATAYVASSKLDSAILLSENLLDQLKPSGQADSPLGLKVQLLYGTALEYKGLDTTAVLVLLHVQQASEEKNQWGTYAEASRALASLYEKIQRVDQSILQLRLAQAAIARYGPDSIYPRFAIRISSWHRMFGDQDSAMFYAREVLRTAPKFGQTFEEAEGHLLMGLLLKDYQAQLGHYTAAARLYRKAKNYDSLCGLFSNLTNLHFREDKFMEALAYTDSIFKTAPKAIAAGKNRLYLLYSAYQLRGEIYKSLGRPTALYYIKKGYEMELEYTRALNNEKTVAVDARYTDLKKSQQIEAQNLQIEAEKERRGLATVILLIVLLFSAVLAYYYVQLQKVNKKAQQQSEQLKTLDIAKSRFFANVSHELRTPLTLLLGPVSTLLKEPSLSDKQAHLLQLAHQSGKQLEQLVTDILDLSKLEMGKMELDEKPTELAAFFRMHLAQFESLAESRGIGFSFDIAVADDAVVHLDQAKCRQILNNLLANAFKFTPSGGHVAAALALTDGWLHLSIADTGPGIHPDDLPNLFDRYFQTTRPDKPAEGGTGIGLALCHEYAQLFGGKIEVDSTLGEGSVFRVAFPVALASGAGAYSETPVSPITVADSDVWPQSFATSETSASPYTAVGKPTILVVEDNPDLQAYIRLILSEKYHVVTAENGQAALGVMGYELGEMSEPTWFQKTHHASRITPDLILSDLMMPVMDGHQLLERLKSDDATRHIPVIMLTARADARDKLRALRIGVDDYLHKPFDEEELLARIENLLRNQAARQQAVAGEVEPETARPLMSAPDREWLATFEGYIQKHYANDILSVSGLAHEFAMSESTLLRQLKRLTGLSPVQYVQEVRLEEARRLLESRAYNSIAQVAAKVGYEDARSFARSFKQRYGKLPSEM